MSLPYHFCPDMTDEVERPDDTEAMVEVQASIARSERHAAILARLADMGMEIAEALTVEVKKTPSPDLAAAFAKVAQAVRRTIALEEHLAKGLEILRNDLFAKRETLWEKAARAEGTKKQEAVDMAMADAIYDKFPDSDEANLALIGDVEMLLADADEFQGWIDRPVGEIIAGLCKALNLDPDWAIQDEDGRWMVKRGPCPPEVSDYALVAWPPPNPAASAREDADPAPA
jgi:hypothetical protein